MLHFEPEFALESYYYIQQYHTVYETFHIYQCECHLERRSKGTSVKDEELKKQQQNSL